VKGSRRRFAPRGRVGDLKEDHDGRGEVSVGCGGAGRTADLVHDKACELMFVLGLSKITGGIQGIVNPTATR
jgi:hypothetical protein